MTLDSATFGSLGAEPDDILATDFYTFFHFGSVGKVRAETGATIESHRTAGQFRELVVLDVIAAADGHTDALSLQVARAFVDDPRDGVFARDLVISFIREGSAGQGFADEVASLLRDMWSPQPWRHEVSYTDSNPIPPAPLQPGDFRPATGVLIGAKATFSTPFAQSELRMSNDRFDGVGALTVSFHR